MIAAPVTNGVPGDELKSLDDELNVPVIEVTRWRASRRRRIACQNDPVAKMLSFYGRLALIYTIGTSSGYAFSLLHFPLPWVIGPSVVIATAVAFGWHAKVPSITRSWGQIIVAGSIGLSMTPAAAQTVGTHLPEMIGAALFTILAGLAVAGLLMRSLKIDAVTACLACVPLGPMEAARLAERYGVSPPSVALAQAVRTISLVLLIPPLLFLLNGVTATTAGVVQGEHDYVGVVVLLLGSFLCGGLAASIGFPNGAFIGALTFSAVSALLSLRVSTLPYGILAGGQVLLGVSLGCMFDKAILRKLKAFALASVATNLALLVLCATGGISFAFISGLPWQTLVLATAPGSLTEMSLTAKLMHFDVPLVTAFHILRIFIILMATPAIFSIVRWMSSKFDR
ncbi:MAG: AbrB family transcriptional regulator [Dongiaceae bacterium]